MRRTIIIIMYICTVYCFFGIVKIVHLTLKHVCNQHPHNYLPLLKDNTSLRYFKWVNLSQATRKFLITETIWEQFPVYIIQYALRKKKKIYFQTQMYYRHSFHTVNVDLKKMPKQLLRLLLNRYLIKTPYGMAVQGILQLFRER